MRGTAVLFCLSVLLTDCSSSDSPQLSDQSYFPLRVGNFSIYQVDETNIQRLACSTDGQTIKNYQLKELISDSIKNAEGSYTYTIHRYTRPDFTQPWVDLNTWTARMNNNQVIVNEGNIPYLKFTFPLREKNYWNVNSFNNEESVIDTLRNLRQQFTLPSGQKFQNTFLAGSDNGEFIIFHDKHVEVYAPSIGLIYKELEQLYYFDNSSYPCYGQQVARSGTIYFQSLISYGHQ